MTDTGQPKPRGFSDPAVRDKARETLAARRAAQGIDVNKDAIRKSFPLPFLAFRRKAKLRCHARLRGNSDH